MSPFAAALMAIATATTASAAQNDQSGYERRLLVATLATGGGNRERFVIDSGSPHSYFNPRFRRGRAPESIKLYASGHYVASVRMRPDPGRFLEQIGRHSPVGGLLGLDFLEQVLIGFDVRDDRIAIWPGNANLRSVEASWFGASASKRRPIWQRSTNSSRRARNERLSACSEGVKCVPLKKGSEGELLAEVRVGEVKGRALLDTGAVITAASVNCLARVPHFPLDWTELLTPFGLRWSPLIVVPSIEFGGRRDRFVEVASTETPPQSDCILVLGLDELSLGRCLLNAHSRALFFKSGLPMGGLMFEMPPLSVFMIDGRLVSAASFDGGQQMRPVRVAELNGIPAREIERAFRPGPQPTPSRQDFDIAERLWTSFEMSGLDLKVVCGEFTRRLRVKVPPGTAPEGPISAPPGPPSKGYHWRYISYRGWLQVKD